MKKNTEDAAHVWGEMVVAIFRLNSLFLEKGNEIAKPAGQTSARWQVLASAYLQPQSVSQIARRMGLTRQSVQRIADILVGDKLATYEKNENHKRAKLVKLTAKGKKAMEAIAKEQRIYATKWSKKVGFDKVLDALETLRKVEDVVGD